MIILITGASHTGKTALAQKLLEKYKYPYLSIDHLKMGLIRSGNTELTPVSAESALTDYLWPIVTEIIKTAIENKQNLIVEGCYIPFDWSKDFEPKYLDNIKYYCLVMSDKYIKNHFDYIKKYACVIEDRIDDAGCTLEAVRRDNAEVLRQCQNYKIDYLLIDEDYWFDITEDEINDINKGIEEIHKRMDHWFTIDKIDEKTYMISEYRHWEETHCYLLNGEERSLLIDTGLGISNIYDEVVKLTDKPIVAVATHIHWDHIGGHKYFPDFYAHAEELDWLNGKFPLSMKTIKDMVIDRCDLPTGFDVNDYELFQGVPTKLLADHDIIDIGGRRIEVLHTPGHAPGHLCFWEREKGYLFTGDLVYKDILFAYFPSTDPEAYLASLEKISVLPVKKVFPAHHSLDIKPEILIRMREAFEQLKADGKLHHGSGTFNYGDWGVWL